MPVNREPDIDPPSDTTQLESGIYRSATEGKIDWLLVRDGPMLRRWAKHISYWAERRGGKRNWMKAHTEEDLQRFRESAARHFEQWLAGETDEDHAAAVFFNMNGVEHIRESTDHVDVTGFGGQKWTIRVNPEDGA